MNRYQLESMRSGIAKELQEATGKLDRMYTDPETKQADREAQKSLVKDIKERLEGINLRIQEMDDEAARKLAAKGGAGGEDKGERLLKAKAELYRSTIQNRPMDATLKAGLLDDAASGGDKFLPKNVASQILAEPMAKNPLRGHSTMTSITNLEIPRIAFTLDDDAFVADGATAKEMVAKGSNVAFGRHKFKVFVDVSETVLLGTDSNLVATIENGLQSGLAKKEKKVAFAASPASGEEHMSFYGKTEEAYNIKATECDAGTGLFDAILAGLADLEEDYRDNAKVVMRYADYLSILKELANGSATLYGVPPQEVLGVPAIFCDLATIPVVGDFSYSHFNYDPQMLYEQDKNVKTGMQSFVLTAWMDHQIKLASAFRLITIKSSQ